MHAIKKDMLPIKGVRQIAHTSHSTSQLHMATKFHFLSVNTVSLLLLLSLLDVMVPQFVIEFGFAFRFAPLLLTIRVSLWPSLTADEFSGILGLMVVSEETVEEKSVLLVCTICVVDVVEMTVSVVDSVANNVDSLDILKTRTSVFVFLLNRNQNTFLTYNPSEFYTDNF